MDVLQDEFQAARRKIYLTPMVAPAAGGPESGFFLPPVHDGQDKIRVPMSLSPQEMASQIERFRTLLREKEGELLKLRHEKILLKQVRTFVFITKVDSLIWLYNRLKEDSKRTLSLLKLKLMRPLVSFEVCKRRLGGRGYVVHFTPHQSLTLLIATN